MAPAGGADGLQEVAGKIGNLDSQFGCKIIQCILCPGPGDLYAVQNNVRLPVSVLDTVVTLGDVYRGGVAVKQHFGAEPSLRGIDPELLQLAVALQPGPQKATHGLLESRAFCSCKESHDRKVAQPAGSWQTFVRFRRKGPPEAGRPFKLTQNFAYFTNSSAICFSTS